MVEFLLFRFSLFYFIFKHFQSTQKHVGKVFWNGCKWQSWNVNVFNVYSLSIPINYLHWRLSCFNLKHKWMFPAVVQLHIVLVSHRIMKKILLTWSYPHVQSWWALNPRLLQLPGIVWKVIWVKLPHLNPPTHTPVPLTCVIWHASPYPHPLLSSPMPMHQTPHILTHMATTHTSSKSNTHDHIPTFSPLSIPMPTPHWHPPPTSFPNLRIWTHMTISPPSSPFHSNTNVSATTHTAYLDMHNHIPTLSPLSIPTPRPTPQPPPTPAPLTCVFGHMQLYPLPLSPFQSIVNASHPWLTVSLTFSSLPQTFNLFLGSSMFFSNSSVCNLKLKLKYIYINYSCFIKPCPCAFELMENVWK